MLKSAFKPKSWIVLGLCLDSIALVSLWPWLCRRNRSKTAMFQLGWRMPRSSPPPSTQPCGWLCLARVQSWGLLQLQNKYYLPAFKDFCAGLSSGGKGFGGRLWYGNVTSCWFVWHVMRPGTNEPWWATCPGDLMMTLLLRWHLKRLWPMNVSTKCVPGQQEQVADDPFLGNVW